MQVNHRRLLSPLAAILVVTLAGCAATYAPAELRMPDELRGVQSTARGDVTVSVSILTDDQSLQHFGVDLGARDVQALWISVRNESGRRLWLIRSIVDPDFYSAEEVALLAQGDVPRKERARLHQDFRDESIRSLLAPRAITEGFVYLPRVEGGRYVDIRLQADSYQEDATRTPGQPSTASAPRELRFEFALPLPDGDFDYERLDPARTYAGRELPNLRLDELRAALEQLPCCAANADGLAEGDPLNIALVGESSEVLHSLTRAGWSFTHRITLRTVGREIGAVLEGVPYAVAPVSDLHVFDRRQDVALQRARRSISQRNHMRLWLAPFRYEGRQVWIGQVSRDIGVKVTPKSPTLTTHIIDPEVDTTREYLLHSLVAAGFVERFGFVKGAAAATPASPRFNLTGDPYHSDGMRLVVLLAPQPVPPESIRNLLWEQSGAPIAEGQSEAAKRNVRPLGGADPQ
jgi:LssY C-terminus